MINFITNTLPKPVLFALAYRLTVLHLASFILPTIGADSWEMEYGVDDGWNARPVMTDLQRDGDKCLILSSLRPLSLLNCC